MPNLLHFEELAKTDPKRAMAQSEAAAMLSLDALKNLSGPRADEVVAFYNYAVARLVEQMMASKEKPWENETQLAGPSGPLGLSLKSDQAGAYIPGFDRLLATDPSGLPYTLSSALFRRYLEAIYQKYPNTPKAVLIGHSMGGLVADMMIRDSAGTQYCDDVLGKPLDHFHIESDQLMIIKDSLIFNASTHVGRVIFIATPHKGADMASGLIGRLGSRLVRLPAKLVAIGPELVDKAVATNGKKLSAAFRIASTPFGLQPAAWWP